MITVEQLSIPKCGYIPYIEVIRVIGLDDVAKPTEKAYKRWVIEETEYDYVRIYNKYYSKTGRLYTIDLQCGDVNCYELYVDQPEELVPTYNQFLIMEVYKLFGIKVPVHKEDFDHIQYLKFATIKPWISNE